MAQFGGVILTNAGRNILAKALTGKPLIFTKAWAGDGFIPDGAKVEEFTDLVHPRRSVEIKEMSIPPGIGTAKISLELTNKDLTDFMFLHEFGLYAQDPDTLDECLYSYCNSGNTADFMPGQDGPDAVYYRLDITVIVDQAKGEVLQAEIALKLSQTLAYWNEREASYAEKFTQYEQRIKALEALGLYVDSDGDVAQGETGTPSTPSPTLQLPIASKTQAGIVKIGDNINVTDDGTISGDVVDSGGNIADKGDRAMTVAEARSLFNSIFNS